MTLTHYLPCPKPKIILLINSSNVDTNISDTLTILGLVGSPPMSATIQPVPQFTQ